MRIFDSIGNGYTILFKRDMGLGLLVRSLLFLKDVNFIPFVFLTTGITLGYILHQKKHKKIHLNSFLSSLLWILSLVTLIGLTLGSQVVRSAANNAPQIAHGLYMSLLNNTWALSIAWIVFAIQNGSTGIIKWFLEIPHWQPIGRMGLSMYLLSQTFQMYIISMSRERIYFSELHTLHAFLADFTASLMLATVGYLAFETPFLIIEYCIYDKYFRRK